VTDRTASATDPTGPEWFTSSYSGGEGNECVEVADLRSRVGVRDSKDPQGPALSFRTDAWADFVASVKAGGFDD
jgi:hypothetical protein